MDEGAREFIERLGLVAEEEGLPRIGARLIGYLMLQDGPRSLDRIAADLQVSKASISVNARWLVQRGILERTSEPGDRRDYYRLGEEPWERMFASVRRRIGRMREVLAAGRELLSPEAEVGHRRVAEWERFYAFVLDEFGASVERWQALRAQGDAVGGASSAGAAR